MLAAYEYQMELKEVIRIWEVVGVGMCVVAEKKARRGGAGG